MQNYKDLIVWQKAMELVKSTYETILLLPTEERFALAEQMRRSAISIPSNIAEGYERKNTKEYIRFLLIANASRAELATQFEICKMLEYINDINELIMKCDEIGKMINGIIKGLKAE